MDIKIGDEIQHRFFGRGRVESVNVKGAYIVASYPHDEIIKNMTHPLPSISWTKVES